MPYEFLQDEELSKPFLKGAARNIVRPLEKIGTRLQGTPGDILSIANEYIAKPLTQAITGKEGLPYEETFLGKIIEPTEAIRKRTEGLTGDFLQPQNKIEQFADDVLEDFSLLLTPMGLAKNAQALKAGSKLIRPLALSLGVNLSGTAAEQISGEKETGSNAKAGLYLLSSFINPRLFKKKVGEIYNKADAALPENARVKVNTKGLDALERDIQKGRSLKNLSPSEKFVMDEVKKAKGLIQNGSVSVPQIRAQKRSLNEELNKHIYSSEDRAARARAKSLATGVSRWYSEALQSYGKQNPEFLKNLKAADEATANLHKSEYITRKVEEHAKYVPKVLGLLHLYGLGLTTASLGTGYGAYEAGKFFYRISKSPTLRKIYARSVREAASDNFKAFNKSLKELDEAMQEDLDKDRYEFID